jgi:hypothetical protein
LWFVGLVVWYAGFSLCRYLGDPAALAIHIAGNAVIVGFFFGLWAAIRKFRQRAGQAKPLHRVSAGTTALVASLATLYLASGVISGRNVDGDACLAGTLVTFLPTFLLVMSIVGAHRLFRLVRSRRHRRAG